jgi:release factor glutamine methyltransferase
MRPAEVARRGADYLRRHGVDGSLATTESEALLQRVLGVDRPALFTRDAGLTTAEAKAYGRALCRRCTGTPLQHLTGEQGFRRVVLEVRPGVFVPRPETEVLVDVVLRSISSIDAPIVVDLCTGTGAVALAVADEHPGAIVYATDISDDAVELARANAERLGLPATVASGDLFAPLPRGLEGKVDVVCANPPYVPRARRDELPAEVLADPEEAVFGEPELYDRIFAGAMTWVRPGGTVAVEIEDDAGSAISDAASAAGLADVVVKQDLTGRDRVVVGRRRP